MQRLSTSGDTYTSATVLANNALHDSTQRLRQMTTASSDHLLLVDRGLRVLFVNRATAGQSPEQLVGHSIEVLLPARTRERALGCMQRVLHQGTVDRFAVEWSTERDTTRFFEVRVSPVREQDGIVALALNASDTTEHVLAQRAVATQAKMIESMLEGVALINETGAIVITNPAFDALFGYPRGMMIGESVAVLAGGSQNDRGPLDRAMLSGLNGNSGPWALEFDAPRRGDRARLTVAGALSRLDDATGRTHLLLVLQDVSERKLLEGAVLEAVNREQYRIGNDLHDGLGQELTGIALLLRCLAGRLAVEHRAVLPDVESITRLVSNAVESTRSLARGLSPVNLERGGLRDALAGLAMHARNVYGIKAVFTNRLQPTVTLNPEVANHLYRIAQEAITNAVKHGQAKVVRMHLSAMQRKIRLAITDDGCGLPPESSQASGMGLRIMRYRARIARGEVRIERGEPNGTRVICECPIEAPGGPRRTARAKPHSAAHGTNQGTVKRASGHRAAGKAERATLSTLRRRAKGARP